MLGYKIVKIMNMSTITEQIVETDSNEPLEEVSNMLIDIERKMSFYKKESDIGKINSGSLKNIKVSHSTFEVIEEGIKYAELTEGAFDIALGAVIDEWGIFSEKEHRADSEKIINLKTHALYKNIILDKKNKSVALKYDDIKLDLGGIAKGYASQKAIEIYKNHGIKSAMINIGGNVQLLGRKSNGDLWSVGIQNPYKERGEIVGALQCEDISVVTSGNYVRYFQAEGEKFGHILNPINGQPVKGDFVSVTVVCKNGVKADALSTALFVMGNLKKVLDFLENTNDCSVILLTNNNEFYISRTLKDNFFITEDFQGKIYII